MSQVQADLQAAFEERGYDVGDVSRNRDRLRVVVLADDAPADELRSIVTGVVGEDGAFGLTVATESLDGQDGVSTVVSFRRRG